MTLFTKNLEYAPDARDQAHVAAFVGEFHGARSVWLRR